MHTMPAYLHVLVGQLLKGASLEPKGFKSLVQFGDICSSNSFEEVVCKRRTMMRRSNCRQREDFYAFWLQL